MTREQLVNDVYTCASCGFCRFGCPVYDVVGFERVTVRGRMLVFKKILEGRMEYTDRVTDSIYMCAGCGNCTVECPTGIDFVEMARTLREDLVRRGQLPESLRPIRGILVEKSNPFGEPLEERGAWVPPQYQEPEKSANLYFAGCTASYSLNRVAKSILRILEDIGYDFTTLGGSERCCGNPLFRMGESEAAKEMMEENCQRFDELGVEQIFTSCAGCVTTFTHDYPQKYEVKHVTQLLAELLKEGRLQFDKELGEKVIYFDGCDIGRHCGIYEEPRSLLKAIPGVELIEFDYNREEGMCCGGPLMSSYPGVATEIASMRMKEAEEKGAGMVVTACPACFINLKAGAKEAGVKVSIQDIALLLPRLVKKEKRSSSS